MDRAGADDDRAAVTASSKPVRDWSLDGLRAVLARDAVGQLIRFAIAGVGVTALSALVYLAAAMLAHLQPLRANLLSHLVGVAAGYAIHSRWSFRAGGGNEAAMLGRFVAVSGVGLALNSLWVWLATVALRLPAWTPVPAMVVATPLASFALNRTWVFRASGQRA
jgi:putative flippase GtrA